MHHPEILRQRQLSLYSEIPEGLRCGLVHAIVFGYPPGGFLRAVFANDLMGAFGHASEDSVQGMLALLTWINSFAPRGCWGSKDALSKWSDQREELLPLCRGLHTGLEIFAELGDSVAQDALDTLRASLAE